MSIDPTIKDSDDEDEDKPDVNAIKQSSNAQDVVNGSELAQSYNPFESDDEEDQA